MSWVMLGAMIEATLESDSQRAMLCENDGINIAILGWTPACLAFRHRLVLLQGPQTMPNPVMLAKPSHIKTIPLCIIGKPLTHLNASNHYASIHNHVIILHPRVKSLNPLLSFATPAFSELHPPIHPAVHCQMDWLPYLQTAELGSGAQTSRPVLHTYAPWVQVADSMPKLKSKNKLLPRIILFSAPSSML